MTLNKASLDMYPLACTAANVAEAKKALDTMMLETTHVSCLADYFIVCSGESPAQIRSIADAIQKSLVGGPEKLLGRERDAKGQWELLDFGSLVVHVMHRDAREFYGIEELWSHADVIPREEWLEPYQAVS